MPVLQRYQCGLGWAHHCNRQGYCHDRPEDCMDPERWIETKLDPECQSYDDGTEHQNRGDDRSIACVRLTKVESANVAGVSYFQ